MKYWFGALCVLFGAWTVYRAFARRQVVVQARARAAAEDRQPEVPRHLKGLDALRVGLAPLFVLAILLAGLVLSAMWFVLDQERIFSIFDILGFLLAIFAYAFSMFVRLQYSTLGLDMTPAE